MPPRKEGKKHARAHIHTHTTQPGVVYGGGRQRRSVHTFPAGNGKPTDGGSENRIFPINICYFGILFCYARKETNIDVPIL